jgi:membrane-associated phospholipid phosphatase
LSRIGVIAPASARMNLTDRIYVAVHVVLTLLVCVRHGRVDHWPWYVLWNICAVAAILLLAHKQRGSLGWQFAHDWLPTLFFITVFEEVSFLSLSIQSDWQNSHLIAFESLLFAVPPIVWMHERTASWLVELMEFGYLVFYPLYPVVGGLFWAWRKRPRLMRAFRQLTDALSLGYVLCYAIYLLFPTQSPANLGVEQFASGYSGPFQFMVHWIQKHGGVHGNAFPSAHIMLAFVVLMFAYRFLPRVGPWLLVPILLMCGCAVYDGYHYASDVVAGALVGILAALTVSPTDLPSQSALATKQ